MHRFLIVLVLLAACGDAVAPAATESTSRPEPPATVVDADEVMLEVHRGGGLCIDGPCSTTWTVFADGRVEVSDGDAFVIAAPDLSALRSELAIGFGELRPFTGTCPAAYDGPQFTYAVGTTEVDSCISDVGESGLVRLINAALRLDVIDY